MRSKLVVFVTSIDKTTGGFGARCGRSFQGYHHKKSGGASMKHGQLRSVAHSIADSLAGGVSLITGFYDLRIYEDAMRSEDGVLTVDLLNGRVVRGTPSADVVSDVLRIPKEFDRLCSTKGLERSDCRRALAHFHATPTTQEFTLVVEDNSGRITETDFQGVPARRVMELDHLGRLRRRATRRP